MTTACDCRIATHASILTYSWAWVPAAIYYICNCSLEQLAISWTPEPLDDQRLPYLWASTMAMPAVHIRLPESFSSLSKLTKLGLFGRRLDLAGQNFTLPAEAKKHLSVYHSGNSSENSEWLATRSQALTTCEKRCRRQSLHLLCPKG